MHNALVEVEVTLCIFFLLLSFSLKKSTTLQTTTHFAIYYACIYNSSSVSSNVVWNHDNYAIFSIVVFVVVGICLLATAVFCSMWGHTITTGAIGFDVFFFKSLPNKLAYYYKPFFSLWGCFPLLFLSYWLFSFGNMLLFFSRG